MASELIKNQKLRKKLKRKIQAAKKRKKEKVNLANSASSPSVRGRAKAKAMASKQLILELHEKKAAIEVIISELQKANGEGKTERGN